MALQNAYVSPEDYLEAERRSATKHEYFDGRIYAMAGAKWPHNQICSNLIRELGNRLKGGECQAQGSDMRVATPGRKGFAYPDVSVVCGDPELKDEDNLLNPVVIIEVLSPSTADFDRRGKFERYKAIPSLAHYVLIEQAYCWIDVFTRAGEGKWLVESVAGVSQAMQLPAIDCSIPVNEIYDRVKLGEPPIESDPRVLAQE